MAKEMKFTGNETLLINRIYKDIPNYFTYEFWVKPENSHQINYESTLGVNGVYGEKFAISPDGTGDSNSAGMGISIGSNGVSVYEQSMQSLTAMLVYETKITSWTHIAVVYKKKTPSLYINGKFVKTGLSSSMDYIFPTGKFGGFPPNDLFKGTLKNIKIWKEPLTEKQILIAMNQYPNTQETRFFSFKKQMKAPIRPLEDDNTIEISIVIPSHNKYPQNLLTLYSLENQTFNLSKVEVIVVDDGSTDETFKMIMDHSFPFHLKYIKCEKNAGRPRARNLGLHVSSGKTIIFLDAEILVERDFIEQHYTSHIEKPNLVVSAVMQLNGLYSVIFPDFEQKQLTHLFELLKDQPGPLSKWQLFIQNQSKVEIFTKEDILQEKYKTLSFPKPLVAFYENCILKPYGDHFSGFHLPWLSFATGNISVRKEMLEKTGYFDERFKEYGWEDIELGYRLHLAGAEFFFQRKIISYHQEHPISVFNMNQIRRNFLIFQQKHQAIEVYLLAILELNKGFVFKDVNNILIDYRQLCSDFPNDYAFFKEAFNLMLVEVGYLQADNSDINNLLKKIEIKNNFHHYHQLMDEKRQLVYSGKYKHLLEMFNLLESL
ncbi:glycosyltransferase [Metabacillus idriensis]|uniref:glycosyltransferase n=1 Tax=Metabacillus idriensis TaxID=324768 RepID=UPI00174CC50F|nr:glycosyltransferase [Metabacillus idriensis]